MPRCFAIDPSGRRLYAANEKSDTTVAFDRDADPGRLRECGTVIRTGSPVCLLLA